MRTTDPNAGDRPTNWGRWGSEDERGALNLLTPERVAAALARPNEGRVYALGTEVGKRGILARGRNPTWHVTIQVQPPGDAGRGRAEDMVHMHTHAHTHIDGLAHVWYDGQLFNGVPVSSVGRGGARRMGVEHMGGIVGHAVVLDLAADGPEDIGHAFTAAALEDAERRAGVRCADADVILLRTGWTDLHDRDPERYHAGEPGLGPEGAGWIAACDPVCVGVDNFALEALPPAEGISPLYCHELFLRDLGVPIIETLSLTAPMADGVTEGVFVAAPLKIEHGLGSPLNPLLIA
jgi:kynurenine formamidase